MKPDSELCESGPVDADRTVLLLPGGLTDDERRTLDACPNIEVVTIPGTSFFLPNEESERIAGYVVEALARL